MATFVSGGCRWHSAWLVAGGILKKGGEHLNWSGHSSFNILNEHALNGCVCHCGPPKIN